jgi:hypothetical protein
MPNGNSTLSFVIPRACDVFDLSVFSTPQPAAFNLHHKTVILSEALRRSIANKGLYSAESKDPGDACWQMLLGAFRPQTTPEDKKVTNSERSRGICGSADLSWKCFPSRCTETFGAHRKTLFAQHVRGSLYFLLSRADSMAAVTCGESGVTAGSNRSSGLPSRSNRNLVKFHLISPPICGLTALSVRKA